MRRYTGLAALSIGLLLSAARNAHSQDFPTAPHDDAFVAGQAMAISVPLDTGSFLNGGYPVDSLGYVDLPVLGRFFVSGKTRDEVEAFLAAKLSNYLKDTHVRAVPAIRLTLLGFWTHQGQYYLSPNTTVWEAVHAAGGIGGERNLGKIKVQRGEQELGISLLDEYSAGRTLAQAGIRSGDIFIIPIPRDNTGGWYWFKEGLTATAQLATVVGTILTAYITYTVLDRR